eukprot:1158076-Pelagomonas_calceolata.AAC.3
MKHYEVLLYSNGDEFFATLSQTPTAGKDDCSHSPKNTTSGSVRKYSMSTNEKGGLRRISEGLDSMAFDSPPPTSEEQEQEQQQQQHWQQAGGKKITQ